MESFLTDLVESRKDKLFFYSPYNFLRKINPDLQLELLIRNKILSVDQNVNKKKFMFRVGDQEYIFLYEYLNWDSDFFKRKCYKLNTVLYNQEDPEALIQAIKEFKKFLSQQGNGYCFGDFPAEDIFLIQCLGLGGIKIVETRLHYFKSLADFKELERFPVRLASIDDVENISEVAGYNRNEFDRVHADFDFEARLADEYLKVYAAAAVKGFCDAVLVPAEPGLPVDSFLAVSNLKEEANLMGTPCSRIVLTAVGRQNKGWHKKLVSEALFYAKENQSEFMLMTTQSTNRAVFRTCEKLQFQLGGLSHLMSFSF